MRRWIVIGALLCCLLAWIPGCTSQQLDTTFTLAVATDLHYLAPSLTDNGSCFVRSMAAGDGKMTIEIDAIVDTFLEQVIEEQPDALLLTGDLALNGEAESHRVLADKLAAVQEAGVAVLVLPGNHDIDNDSAVAYSGDSYYSVESVSVQEFRELYAAFGYENARACDPDSFSYVWELNEGVWLIALDGNGGGMTGVLSDETQQWLDAQLELAEQAGVQVITATHQNLVEQNRLLSFGYTLYNATAIKKQLSAAAVRLNLSGHGHMQHWASDSESGLTDIQTAALSVTPFAYGWVSGESKGVSYSTRQVDMERYQAGFSAYAQTYFRDCAMQKAADRLADSGMSADTVTSMAEFAADVNLAYFAGDRALLFQLAQDDRRAQWQELSPLAFSLYLEEVLAEAEAAGDVELCSAFVLWK